MEHQMDPSLAVDTSPGETSSHATGRRHSGAALGLCGGRPMADACEAIGSLEETAAGPRAKGFALDWNWKKWKLT